jgi:enterochelin esterase-like enzyme
MTLDHATGMWSYTLPLPSGVFTYQFYINCTSPPPTLTGCTPMADPSNPPWNTHGSLEQDSEVYVPSDPRFGTPDMSWEAPNRHEHGTLLDVSYPDPQSTHPVGSHPLAIYLPPGYQPHRRIAYPTLYLSHGLGGNEIDWSTGGAANSIIDNLIASRRAQPMIIVMTNFNNLGPCPPFNASCYARDLTTHVIPFVQTRFNVSRSSTGRAFAGLSVGGAMANFLLFNDTTQFGYVGSWSIAGRGAPGPSSPQWQNPALRTRLGLEIGGGKFDLLTIPAIDTYEQELRANGIPFSDVRINGGHEWYTWRQLLHDYASTVVFRGTTTTVRFDPQKMLIIARVIGDTPEPVGPRGTLQFRIGRRSVGHPESLRRGTAVLALPRVVPGQSVTAVYNGDNYYDRSSSPAVSIALR